MSQSVLQRGQVGCCNLRDALKAGELVREEDAVMVFVEWTTRIIASDIGVGGSALRRISGNRETSWLAPDEK